MQNFNELDGKGKVEASIAGLTLEKSSKVFYGALLVRYNIIFTNAIPTAATDGLRLMANPEFFAPLTKPQTTAVNCHEGLHIALLHPFQMTHFLKTEPDERLGPWKQQQIINIAQDSEINYYLEKDGFDVSPLPMKDGKTNPWVKIPAELADKVEDLGWLGIYRWLLKDAEKRGKLGQEGQDGAGDQQGQQGSGKGKQQQGKSKGNQSGSGKKSQPQEEGSAQSYVDSVLNTKEIYIGDVHPGPEGKEGADAQERIRIAVSGAEDAAKKCGHAPAHLQRIFGQLREAIIDWRAVLAQFVSSYYQAEEYDWRWPSRRHIGRGLYLPALKNEVVGDIWLQFDTSGSIGEEEICEYLGETLDICGIISNGWVSGCDTEATEPIEITQNSTVEEIAPAVHGGGGTDFAPAFVMARAHSVTPACFVYFTDGYCDSFGPAPAYPVLWILTHTNPNFNPPFGEVVAMRP